MSSSSDQYKTIDALSIGEFKDRGSKFIAYAYPVSDEQDVMEHLQDVRKEHPKARHHCYAYRLGLDKNNFRANDDGEPSGTAGRPILGQIDSFELTNVLIIVVRYFGGTLLGTSGLIQAYKLSAADALEKAEIVTKTISDIYQLTFTYANMGEVMNAIKRLNLEMIEQDFGILPKVSIAIRQSEVAETLVQLKALVAKITVEEAETLEEVDGLEVELLRIAG